MTVEKEKKERENDPSLLTAVSGVSLIRMAGLESSKVCIFCCNHHWFEAAASSRRDKQVDFPKISIVNGIEAPTDRPVIAYRNVGIT